MNGGRKKTKGTVGVIGLGIMGGAFAKNLARAGWRVVGYDISAARRREAARAGVEIASERRRCRRASADHPHQPAQAAGADGRRARHRRRQAAAQGDRGNEHLRDFRQGKSRSACSPRPATSCSMRRSAAPARRPPTRDLVFYASGDAARDQAAAADVRGFRPPRLRRRRLRQRQQDEIRRQSAGRHQQRRQPPRPWCWA